MNIKEKHLLILLEEYLCGNIVDNNPDATKDGFHEYSWDTLLIELKYNKYLEIYFRYYSTYKDSEDGTECDYCEEVEFTLSSNTSQSLEDLIAMEKQYHVDRNCLFYVIEILKNL